MSRHPLGVVARLALMVAWLAVAMLPGVPPQARAAEYTMTTRVTYEVEPGNERVSVSVRVRFENTTPNPDGEFSVFEVIDLALQPGVTGVEARDSRGTLTVTETERDGYVQASVRPRRAVRFRDRVAFTLSYRLPDGAAPGTRVRPSLVAFPAWSFGTGGRVVVNVPGSYEVSVAGSEFDVERTADGWVLDSGPIDDPSRWVAQVVAAGAASHDVATRAVPLDGGTVDLQVRAWADDPAWGDRTLQVVSAALPLLEDAIGVPYPAAGSLVVEESVTASPDLPGESLNDGPRLLAGYDQPAFTLIHQLSHLWLTPELVADRWISEGFASSYAAAVAGEVAAGTDVEPPYDPARRRDNLADDAFPLVSWGAGESTPSQDAFAYAASWAVADELASLVGDDALRRAWSRIAAGIGPYAPPAEDGSGRPTDLAPVAVDSRALLDHLEAVGERDLARLFERWVFDEGTARLLPARAAARDAYANLLRVAAGWGAPDPVVSRLAAWRFDDAEAGIVEALAWLADRDRLAAAAADAGLTIPQRLRDRYRTAGGGADARAELEAERALVDGYQAALEAAAAERGLLERIGLVGGPEPDAMLRSANQMFAEGDLRSAADTVDDVRLRLEHAATEGLVRVGAALVVVAGLVLLAVGVVRRGRSRPPGERPGSDYTAVP